MINNLIYIVAGVASVVLGSLCPILTCGVIGIVVGALTGSIYIVKIVRGI